jgi:hypothetical protein
MLLLLLMHVDTHCCSLLLLVLVVMLVAAGAAKGGRWAAGAGHGAKGLAWQGTLGVSFNPSRDSRPSLIRRIRASPNESVTESLEALSRASAARPVFFEASRLYTTGWLKPLSVVAIR